jgi:hypothetical protein
MEVEEGVLLLTERTDHLLVLLGSCRNVLLHVCGAARLLFVLCGSMQLPFVVVRKPCQHRTPWCLKLVQKKRWIPLHKCCTQDAKTLVCGESQAADPPQKTSSCRFWDQAQCTHTHFSTGCRHKAQATWLARSKCTAHTTKKLSQHAAGGMRCCRWGISASTPGNVWGATGRASCGRRQFALGSEGRARTRPHTQHRETDTRTPV